jgi:3-phosphoshikimate 1-carboxyvinyltransferase
MIAIQVPGDKSISHRALMLAPLADGTSRLSGLAQGADVAATATAMRALGVEEAIQTGPEFLEVTGPVELRDPDAPIDCQNSGTTARLLLGLTAGARVTATFDGDASLRRRPMARVLDPLRSAGAEVRELGDPGRLPVRVAGGALRAIEHRSPVASAQVKSALLFAGLSAGVPVTVYEPGPSRDHTERLLTAMGMSVETESLSDGFRVGLAVSDRPPHPLDLQVPGDFSSAAFWIALAVLGGAGNGVRIEGVGLNPRRTGLLRVLEAMGAAIDVRGRGETAGEPVGDIVARPSSLTGVAVPADWLPTLVDEIPVLACIASRAAGTTEIRGAAELRVKESDRLAALHANLATLGVTCRELADGLSIEGTAGGLAGTINSHADHRIAMSFGVLGALTGSSIRVDNRTSVEVSYPGFWDELQRIERRREA